MLNIQTRTVFVTSDRKEFGSEREAQIHELATIIGDISYMDAWTRERLAKGLMRRFDLTPKADPDADPDADEQTLARQAIAAVINREAAEALA